MTVVDAYMALPNQLVLPVVKATGSIQQLDYLARELGIFRSKELEKEELEEEIALTIFFLKEWSKS